MAEYGADGSVQRVFDDEPGRTPEGADSAEPDFAPDPWYRNRVLLALWALAVALTAHVDHLRPRRALARRRERWSGHDHDVHHAHPVVHDLVDHHDYPVDDHRGAAPRDTRADTRGGAATGPTPPPRPNRRDITTICRIFRRQSRCRTPWLRCRTASEPRPLRRRRKTSRIRARIGARDGLRTSRRPQRSADRLLRLQRRRRRRATAIPTTGRRGTASRSFWSRWACSPRSCSGWRSTFSPTGPTDSGGPTPNADVADDVHRGRRTTTTESPTTSTEPAAPAPTTTMTFPPTTTEPTSPGPDHHAADEHERRDGHHHHHHHDGGTP